MISYVAVVLHPNYPILNIQRLWHHNIKEYQDEFNQKFFSLLLMLYLIDREHEHIILFEHKYNPFLDSNQLHELHLIILYKFLRLYYSFLKLN